MCTICVLYMYYTCTVHVPSSVHSVPYTSNWGSSHRDKDTCGCSFGCGPRCSIHCVGVFVQYTLCRCTSVCMCSSTALSYAGHPSLSGRVWDGQGSCPVVAAPEGTCTQGHFTAVPVLWTAQRGCGAGEAVQALQSEDRLPLRRGAM